MELPIPKHLKDYLVPVKEKSDHYCVNGNIKCTCGNEKLVLMCVGEKSDDNRSLVSKEIRDYFCLVIKAICPDCNKEIMIFNDSLHGWEGFVCNEGNIIRLSNNSFSNWECEQCKQKKFNVELSIRSQGKEDFMEETGGNFNEADWIEAFEWITININCAHCKNSFKEWISFETM